MDWIGLWVLECDRVNITEGEPEDRQMTTGLHTVRDIFCIKCQRMLGWKYVGFYLAEGVKGNGVSVNVVNIRIRLTNLVKDIRRCGFLDLSSNYRILILTLNELGQVHPGKKSAG
jgi:hypothetical protein